jgi:hypothetical protein
VEAGDFSISTNQQTVTSKHLSDTGGGIDSDSKDRRIRELEEEVARLRERERHLME